MARIARIFEYIFVIEYMIPFLGHFITHSYFAGSHQIFKLLFVIIVILIIHTVFYFATYMLNCRVLITLFHLSNQHVDEPNNFNIQPYGIVTKYEIHGC